MKEFLKIAWRNLWRNRRRTLITIASVLFAVFLALLMRAMQLGSYARMVESSVKSSTGYIQVHGQGFWEEKSIDHSFVLSAEIENSFRAHENVTLMVPRLESFALASSGKQTKGAAVMGTVPAMEDSASGLSSRVIKGRYIHAEDRGVLISAGLASYLGVGVNDTVVLLGQGYHGVTAAAAYPVIGVAEFVMPEMNNQLLYLPLALAQELYDTPGRLTSLSLMLDNPDQLNRTRDELALIDKEGLEVMTWRELMPELVQGIESDNISGLFMLGILYLVVGFGILGTILMMTMERRREFGVMIAVGMRRTKLAFITFLETIMIAVIGILAGVALSTPVIYYFYLNPIPLTGETAEAVLEYNMEPIMPFAFEPGYFVSQSLVVLIITVVAAIYPLSVIGRLKVVNAMKGR